MEDEILKDEPYYKTGGGVTFSGGEPLLQIKDLEPLLKSLKNKNINICFETALFTPKSYLIIAQKYCDNFIVDIKMINYNTCREILGGNIDYYLNNLKILDLKKTTFRIPVTKFALNDSDLICNLLKIYKPKNLEIFKIHDLAKRKYSILNKDFYHNQIDDVQFFDFYEKIKTIIPNTEIIEI